MSTEKPRQPRHYPAEFKMQLIQQALNGNITVAALSRQHGINDNLIFRWIRMWQTDGTVSRIRLRGSAPALLPVSLTSEIPEVAVQEQSRPARKRSAISDPMTLISPFTTPRRSYSARCCVK